MTILTMSDVHRGFIDVDLSEHDCFVCDIDGTVADLTHRRHWLLDKPKNWKAFEQNMIDDKPIDWVIQLCLYLQKQGLTMIMCSGRGEQNREVTERWLDKHGLYPVKLFMRKAGDYRGDDIIKGELLDEIILEGWDPKLSLDDRDRVVAMWRRRGLECIQVAEGNF